METTQSSEEQTTGQQYVKLAKRMYELRKSKQDLEDKMDSISAELDQVRAELTGHMESLEVRKFSLTGMGTFYLSTSAYTKVKEQDQLIAWLDKNGLSNIAPRKVHVPSLKETIESRLSDDLEIPSTDLVEINPHTDVRLRMEKK